MNRTPSSNYLGRYLVIHDTFEFRESPVSFVNPLFVLASNEHINRESGNDAFTYYNLHVAKGVAKGELSQWHSIAWVLESFILLDSTYVEGCKI